MMTRIKGIEVDNFTGQYLHTALWASPVMLPVASEDLVDGRMDVDEDHPLRGISEEDGCDDHFDLNDFTEEAIRVAVKDCARFQEENAVDLSDESAGQAGHDFWLTRNDHGAGFWDGDYEASKGERLTEACKAYSILHVWVDEEGSLHFEGETRLMRVLVMVAVAENGRDLQIVMAARLDKALGVISSIVTLEGKADSRNGNPYCVYGDAVANFAGCDKFDTSISVFWCSSGNLQGWE